MRTRFGILAIGLLVSGCGAGTNKFPIIRDGMEYNATLTKVAQLTRVPFKAIQDGQPISPTESADIKEALDLIEGLIQFKPDNYGPYALKGMSYRALDEPEKARAAYVQSLRLAPNTELPQHRQAIAGIHGQLSELEFDNKNYREAEIEALKGLALTPKSPQLLLAGASAQIEQRKLSDARILLQKCLKADPANERAKNLLKLIGD